MDCSLRLADACVWILVVQATTTPEEAMELLAQGFKEQSIFGEKHLFAKPK